MHNRPSRLPRSIRRTALAAACLCLTPLLAGTLARADVNSVWTNTDANGSYNDANNWTPTEIPTNGNNSNNYNVEITAAPGSAHVDSTDTVDDLTVDLGAALIINAGQTLNVNGPILTDNGTIQIDQLSSNGALNFEANTLLTGTGDVMLDDFNPNARLTATAGVTVTQDTNHTIDGVGEIDIGNFTNNGTVNADFLNHTLLINTPNLTNTNLLEATNHGTLQLSNNTITNTGGTILNNGGTVLINSTSVSGGNLSGAITVNGGNFTNVSISAGAVITIAPNSTLNINGPTLNNNGIIFVDTQSGNGDINFASNTQITGSGTITLNDFNPDARFTSNASVTVTQSSTSTIDGVGEIDSDLTNNGTVNADVTNHTLLLQNNDKTNNNLFEATNGGTLSIVGINLTNTTGLITSDGTSTPTASSISISDGANIIGGNLGGTGTISVNNATFTNVTINAGTTVFDTPGSLLTIAGGSLINNGTIQIDVLSSNAAINFTVDTQITGTGTIFLDEYNPNARFTANANVTVTQASTHTIDGIGQIDATLINNGTINANDNVGTRAIVLQTNDKTNNNLIEATSGGIISIVGINLTNTTGLITSDGTSTPDASSISISSNANIIGGTIGGTGLVSVNNATFTNVTIGTGTPVFDIPGSVLTIAGGSLDNNGSIQIDSLSSNADINFTVDTLITGTGSIFLDEYNPNARFTSTGGATVTQDVNHTIHGIGEIDAPLVNNGTVIADQTVGTRTLEVNGSPTTNNGLFQATNTGILQVSSLTNLSAATLTGGTYEIDANSTMSLPSLFTILSAHVILNGGNTSFTAMTPLTTITSTGTLELKNGAFFSSQTDLLSAGTVNIDATSSLFPSGNYTQTAGTTTVNGQLAPSGLYFLVGGTLKGSGFITGPVSNIGGTVSPGNSPGTLTILGGPYSQGPDGELDIELASASSFDLLAISGNASLDGTLDVTLLGGYIPANGQTFIVLTTTGALTGTFSNPELPAGMAVSYTPDSVILTYTATTPEPASLVMVGLGAAALLTRKRRK